MSHTHRDIVTIGLGEATAACDVDVFGRKGAGLIRLDRLALPVPPGVVVSLGAPLRPPGEEPDPEGEALLDAIVAATAHLPTGEATDGFPPLLAVRASADVALPGVLDTVLNVGLTRELTAQLCARPELARRTLDSRRHVLHGLATAAGVHPFYLDEALASARRARGVPDAASDADIPVDVLRDMVARLEGVVAQHAPGVADADADEQLRIALRGVLSSGDSGRTRRALARRGLERLRIGVIVQRMVAGNAGEESGSGLARSHSSESGEPGLRGEFATDSQGEQQVATFRFGGAHRDEPPSFFAPLRATLDEQVRRLAEDAGRPVRVEFTVERGTLWLCQCTALELSPAAQIRVAVDRAEAAGDRALALRAVPEATVRGLLHPVVDVDSERRVIAIGLAASPGAAAGTVALDADEAIARSSAGEDVVLVVEETGPDDVMGMRAARAIVTARGGTTSHAAVVASQMGTPCIVGCSALRVDTVAGIARFGNYGVHRGAAITVDGTRGEVSLGAVKVRAAGMTDALDRLLGWADELAAVEIRANADRVEDATLALRLGARGVGLARTEHMFLDGARLDAVRAALLASTPSAREEALAALAGQQEHDFAALLRAVWPHPVAVRLLDPPLHEFLPRQAPEQRRLAEKLGMSPEELARTVARMREANPMLGHRGARVGVTFPALYEAQAQALASAARTVVAEGGRGRIEVLLPMVTSGPEVALLTDRLRATIESHAGEAAALFAWGALLETPRSCLMAGEIVQHVDLISFGTNDLTQTALGISRDDTSAFLPAYQRAGLLPTDPFVELDACVLELMDLAIDRARAANPGIRVGVCGEHAGDPASIAAIGARVDVLSCSPWRVPVARLAAARARLPAT